MVLFQVQVLVLVRCFLSNSGIYMCKLMLMRCLVGLRKNSMQKGVDLSPVLGPGSASYIRGLTIQDRASEVNPGHRNSWKKRLLWRCLRTGLLSYALGVRPNVINGRILSLSGAIFLLMT